MNWLFKLGFQQPLEMKDLGSLPEKHSAQHLYEIFKEDFQKELVCVEVNCTVGWDGEMWWYHQFAFGRNVPEGMFQ